MKSSASQNSMSSPAVTDVMVFVPGLGQADGMESSHVAQLLSWEMDQRASDKSAAFAVRPTSIDTEVVYRIERADQTVTTPVLDLYCLEPKSIFETEKSSASPLTSAVTLAITVILGILIWCAAWFRRNRGTKPFAHMLQLLFCLGILLCLGLYFLTAVYAFAQALTVALSGVGGTPLIRWPQWIVLSSALAAVLIPGVREKLTETAEVYQRTTRYLWNSRTRNRLTGELQGLLDRVNRRPEVTNLHLLGFSFGSLVVLDTVYPAGSPDPAPIQQVRSISTVGCPLDLVRMLQQTYPEGRVQATDSRPQWINIYEPRDALASNFNNRNGVDNPPNRGIVLSDGTVRVPDINLAWNEHTKLNIVNLLMLQSLAVHYQYWDRSTRSRTALGSIVDVLFTNTPVLR